MIIANNDNMVDFIADVWWAHEHISAKLLSILEAYFAIYLIVKLMLKVICNISKTCYGGILYIDHVIGIRFENSKVAFLDYIRATCYKLTCHVMTFINEKANMNGWWSRRPSTVLSAISTFLQYCIYNVVFIHVTVTLSISLCVPALPLCLLCSLIPNVLLSMPEIRKWFVLSLNKKFIKTSKYVLIT